MLCSVETANTIGNEVMNRLCMANTREHPRLDTCAAAGSAVAAEAKQPNGYIFCRFAARAKAKSSIGEVSFRSTIQGIGLHK